MEHEFLFDHDGLPLVVRTSGAASAAGSAALDRELVKHPLYRQGMPVLIDNRELDMSEMTSTSVRASSSLMRGFSKKWARGRWAFVVATDLAFGMGRMWQTYTQDGVEAEIQMFRSMDEAREWLLRPE